MMAFASMVTTNPASPNLKDTVGTISTSDDGGESGAAEGCMTKGTSGMVSTVLSSENGGKTNSLNIFKGDNLNNSFTPITNSELSETRQKAYILDNRQHQQPQQQQGSNQHHHQPPSIHSQTSTITSTFSYPAEVKRILHEVARSGASVSIPWVAPPLSSYPSPAVPSSAGRNQRSTHLYLQQHSKRKRQREQYFDFSRNVSGSKMMNRTLINVLKDKRTTNTTTASEEIEKRVAKLEDQIDGTGETQYRSSIMLNNLSSDVLNSRNEGIDGKKHRSHNNRDNGCAASSCSESISSRGGTSVFSIPSSSAPPSPRIQSMQFRSLRGAIRFAVSLVLDHSYKNQGGYKISAVERKQLETKQCFPTSQSQEGNGNGSGDVIVASKILQMDVAFMNRRKALLNMLGDGDGDTPSQYLVSNTQHHSTCLSSGNASDVTFENEDLTPWATAAAKGKKESYNFRANSIYSNFSLDSGHASDTSKESNMRAKEAQKPHINKTGPCGPPFTIQRVAEILLKPDRYYKQTHKLCNALEKLLLVTSTSTAYGGHTGGDTSHNHKEEREMAALADKRGRDETEHRHRRFKRRVPSSDNTDPMLQMNVNIETSENRRVMGMGNTLNYGLAGDSFSSSTPNPILDNQMISTEPDILGDKFVSVDTRGALARTNTVERNDSFPPDMIDRPTIRRHDHDNNTHPTAATLQQAAVDIALSPSLFSATRGLNPLLESHHQELQAHHTAAVLGASNDIAHGGQNVQMEIVIDPSATSSGNAGSGVQSGFVGDLDGRSSASNSDIDSESDDVSFDDSASDRSDGSDSGSFEPCTAARVMALNRMQQQHRREQYLQNRALIQLSSSTFQPPPDSEYQSGDSIDSMMAEDSGGSDCDSSCSDLAD